MAAAPTLSTCVGVGEHLSPVSEHAQEVAWFGASKDGARPVRWSCPCCPGDEYELCTLGAVWFIRRRARGVLVETVRDSRAATEQVWWLLVAGGAR